MEHEIQFGTLHIDGTVSNVKTIKRSDIGKCKHFILLPEHYRSDGSCKCNNKVHRALMIKEWEYSESDFTNIPLID